MSAATHVGTTDWRSFTLPTALIAAGPPEARGLRRDDVRLLVASPAGIRHARFSQLPQILVPGDLVVANDSATLPAAVTAVRRDGRPADVHFSTALPDGGWLVELRLHGGRITDATVGERLELPEGVRVVLRQAWPHRATRTGSRLWRAAVPAGMAVVDYLSRVGRPIRYGHASHEWALDCYQTIFARRPGSAEMASAGRPFSTAVLDGLAARGVGLATVTLHTGVSSPEDGEPPLPEWYQVPPATAAAVNRTRRRHGRVVAVGTTVTRALESAAATSGDVEPGDGWTTLLIGPRRPPRVIDALLTGWHEPRSSHLALVEQVAGADVAARAYTGALQEGYLWHEFGDVCLLLPEP